MLVMGLKVTDEKRPTSVDARQRTSQDVVLEGIQHQLSLLKDSEYRVERLRYFSSGDESVKQVKFVKPRPWFWEEKGQFKIQLRYGANALIELAPGKPTIHAGKSKDDVIKTLEAVAEAVKSGKVDSAISAAAAKAKRKPAA